MDDRKREELRSLGAAAYRKALADAGVTELSPATKARIIEAVTGRVANAATPSETGDVSRGAPRTHPASPEVGEGE